MNGGGVIVKVSDIPAQSDRINEDVRVPGHVRYWHYGCDGRDDRGWGCGYRTLQTICSYITNSRDLKIPTPSLPEIQQILVEKGDKPVKFSGSKEWIGTFEAFLVIDKIHDVSCKIVHVRGGNQLIEHIPELSNHFRTRKCPVMMGGDADAASKCILGVAQDNRKSYLLIADPHLWSPKEVSLDKLLDQGWISWKDVESDFVDSSMYNICLPQL